MKKLLLVAAVLALLCAGGVVRAESASRLLYEGRVSVPVANGVYSVVLGEVRLGMPPLGPAILDKPAGLKLRIWFDDGTHGVAQLGADQPITASGTVASSRLGTPAVRPGQPAPAIDQTGLILNELRQIRMLLERLPQKINTAHAPSVPAQPPPPVRVKLPLKDNSFALGDANAPAMLVEFTDYQCPFCRRFAEETFPDLKKNYIDTGKLRFVSRNLPLPFHPMAAKAAQAALCAGEQGKYWEMREVMFKNNTALKPDDLQKYAKDLGLDVEKFNACLDADRFQEQLKADAADAAAVGITGTPSFVLGKAGKETIEGDRIVGAKPFASLEADVKKLLDIPKEPAQEKKPNP